MTQYEILGFLEENLGQKYCSKEICKKVNDRNPRITARKVKILVKWDLVKESMIKFEGKAPVPYYYMVLGEEDEKEIL